MKSRNIFKPNIWSIYDEKIPQVEHGKMLGVTVRETAKEGLYMYYACCEHASLPSFLGKTQVPSK